MIGGIAAPTYLEPGKGKIRSMANMSEMRLNQTEEQAGFLL